MANVGKVKHKTHKATAKRFKITGSGKVSHFRQNDNAHLKTNKTNRLLARQEGKAYLGSKTESKKIKRLLLS